MDKIISSSNLKIINKKVKLWLSEQKNKSLLRFLTCGSVDDGKSTLIGRIFYETNKIYDDLFFSLKNDSKRYGTQGKNIDLALLVDGLQAEREQGITIDVAYRYFNTKKRKFIIADTPGHIQYTKNMITGASTSDVAILLIDAKKGISEQTYRHTFIIKMLEINFLIVAINKMDLINYNEKIFKNIKKTFLNFYKKIQCVKKIYFVPISAFLGENIIEKSTIMNWYKGKSLLNILEKINIKKNFNKNIRFPIQYVNHAKENFRGYSGTIESGLLSVGEKIKILPSGIKSTIKNIIAFKKNLKFAVAGEAITITLHDDVDISRGDLLVSINDKIKLSRSALCDIIWMSKTPLQEKQNFYAKITNKIIGISIKDIKYQINIKDFTIYNTKTLVYNSIGLVNIIFDQLIPVDKYIDNKITGSMILIDKMTNLTIAACMIRNTKSDKIINNTNYTNFEIEFHKFIRYHFPHWNLNDL